MSVLINKKPSNRLSYAFCPKHLPVDVSYTNTSKLEHHYIKYSKAKEHNRFIFAQNKFFTNNLTGELVKMSKVGLLKELNNNYLKTIFAIQQIQELNKNKQSLFITLTLPPLYHSTINNAKNPLFSAF
jgi:hypothetical protein